MILIICAVEMFQEQVGIALLPLLEEPFEQIRIA
jgi:hypothetical protein